MIFRFADFAVDASRHELMRGDRMIPVEPQVFSLLVLLLRNADRVVSKDELIAEIWQGRAVSDTTLGSRIFALRKTLGDSGEAQAIIRTIPRRGFRFVADVQVEADAAAGTPADAGETAAGAAQRGNARPPREHAGQAGNTSATAHPTLIILPFREASPGLDPYFCDGLTEDVIANLTHFAEIRVIASGTSFRFKDRDLSLAEIAAEVGANYIFEGSARRDDKRLRVAVELNDAATNVTLWADRYDRDVSDVFAVQDAMTHMIVAALGVHVQGAELKRELRKSPRDFDAYECLLHARRYTATLDDAMHAKARELLENAIRIDPNYAEAHALLANVYLAEHRLDANPRPDPIGRALIAAQRAVELDPQSSYAHCWLGISHFSARISQCSWRSCSARSI